MAFNELNSVEHFIIHRLTGVNLDTPLNPLSGGDLFWWRKRLLGMVIR